jgi:hypothetical protein
LRRGHQCKSTGSDQGAEWQLSRGRRVNVVDGTEGVCVGSGGGGGRGVRAGSVGGVPGTRRGSGGFDRRWARAGRARYGRGTRDLHQRGLMWSSGAAELLPEWAGDRVCRYDQPADCRGRGGRIVLVVSVGRTAHHPARKRARVHGRRREGDGRSQWFVECRSHGRWCAAPPKGAVGWRCVVLAWARRGRAGELDLGRATWSRKASSAGKRALPVVFAGRRAACARSRRPCVGRAGRRWH